MKQLQAFGRGFGDGLKSVFEGIKGLVSAFTGGSQDPEVIGRLTGKVIALSAALLVLSPVLSVLSALAATIGMIAGAVRGLTAISDLLGMSQAAGAAGGGGIVARLGLAGLASRLLGGLGLAIVAELGAHSGQIATWLGAPQIIPLIWDGSKAFFSEIGTVLRKALSIKGIIGMRKAGALEAVPAPLERWWNSTDTEQSKPTRDISPEGNQKVIDDSQRQIKELQERIAPNTKAIEDNTKVQKQSFNQSQKLRDLIKPASYTSGSGDFQSLGARVQLAALNAGGALSTGGLTAIGGGSGGSGGGGGGGGEVGGLSLKNNTPGQAFSIPGIGARYGVGGSGGGGSDGSAATAPSGNPAKTFASKAPGIMARLQKDFGLSKEQAAGILGNLGHESAGFTAYGENGGKGPGVGWAQWTDPGRKARFLQYAEKNGLNPRSDEASYGFLKWELQNTHAKALTNLRKQNTVEGATRQFEHDFEAPASSIWTAATAMRVRRSDPALPIRLEPARQPPSHPEPQGMRPTTPRSSSAPARLRLLQPSDPK